jgi:oligopeptidase A
MTTNPLLERIFPVPFERIQPADARPAIDTLLKEASDKLEAIANLEGARTYQNTMVALDHLTEDIDRALTAVRHLESVATTKDLRAVYNEIEPLVSAFYSRIPLHEGLWKAVQAFGATDEAKALTGIHKRYLEKTIAQFKRYGAALPPEGKAQLEKIDVELAGITTKFGENVLDATNAWELIIEDQHQLAGLPPSATTMARESAMSKQKDGWRFTLQAPSYIAVMTYLDDASVREQMYRAYQTRGAKEPFDNREKIERTLVLRREKAVLLGFQDFADFILEDRMAHTGKSAQEFLTSLKQKTERFFAKENDELTAFRKELEGSDAPPLQAWDIGYYAEKLRKARFDFDEEELRPYFPMEKVIGGMFEIVERLYGIKVIEKQSVPSWDPSVKYYEIRDGGEMIGAFYADWYPRENKRGGAWMDAFLTGPPHLGTICGNMNPPSGGKPALLTHRDVETVFHEFGHLLHHCLSRVEIRNFSGTSVAWDFVELPSQIMENWCWERPALDLFARHYETGEPIPETLFQKMKSARSFRAANTMMRQLSFGLVDLALHREYSAAKDGDVISYSRAMLQSFSAAPLPPEHSMMTGFTHLFASPVGYAAAYYSYKWAEVLDADAFTRFRSEGVFNQETGKAFRENILAKGDSEDPSNLYRAFMGRDPDQAALFERAGLAA